MWSTIVVVVVVVVYTVLEAQTNKRSSKSSIINLFRSNLRKSLSGTSVRVITGNEIEHDRTICSVVQLIGTILTISQGKHPIDHTVFYNMLNNNSTYSKPLGCSGFYCHTDLL